MPVREIAWEGVAAPESFRRDVAELCEPVVLRGACTDWPVAAAARKGDEQLFAYLHGLDGGMRAQAFAGDAAITARSFYGGGADGFDLPRQSVGLGAALERIGRNAAPASAHTP